MSKPSLSEGDVNEMLEVIKSGWLSQGKKTKEFENSLSDYLQSKVIVVNSGTSALICSLLAHGIKPGDNVIVPDFTFIATSSAAKIMGANVLPADIDPKTLNINPESVEQLVNSYDIKCVIGVDVAGLSLDLDFFNDLAKRYNFVFIEDAAEAFGSQYKNKKLGSFSHTSIFSFHIAKQITTVEGGCIATTNETTYEKLVKIKDLGREKPGQYIHDLVGGNFRITDIQSSLGLHQLKQIDEFISRRIQIANEYKNRIKNLTFQKLSEYSDLHTYMLFFAFAKNKETRDKMLRSLRDAGIDARMPWLPIHRQPCNTEINSFDCPNADDVYDRAFTLPIFNDMTDEEMNLVIDTCNSI